MGKQERSQTLTHLEMSKCRPPVARVSVSHSLILVECLCLLWVRCTLMRVLMPVIKRLTEKQLVLLCSFWKCQCITFILHILFTVYVAHEHLIVKLMAKTYFPLRDDLGFFLSFSELSLVIFLNWLRITEVSLQVSAAASGKEYLSASALHVCVHVCYMIWVDTPHNLMA